MERKTLYVGLGALAAAAFAFLIYVKQTITIAAGHDVALAAAAAGLVGFAVAGALASLQSRPGAAALPAVRGSHALLAGGSALVLGAAVIHLPLATGPAAWAMVAAYVVAAVVPAVFAGLAFAHALRSRPEEPYLVAAAFFGGGAAAHVLSAAAFDLGGSGGALATVAVLAAAAAVSFDLRAPKARLLGPAILVVAAVGVAVGVPALFRPAPCRANFLAGPHFAVRETAWSATARAEISSPNGELAAGKSPFPALVARPWLSVNGAASSPLLSAGEGGDRALFNRYLPAFPTHVKAPKDALVIDGATFDAVGVAALFGARVDLVADDAAAELLTRDKTVPKIVALRRGSARAFLKRRTSSYDLVLVAPGAAPAPGETAPTLAADYDLTVGAFREYYRALRPGGLLAVAVREGDAAAPGLELAATVFEALGREGEPKAASHVLVFRYDLYTLVIANRNSFSELEVEALSGGAPAGMKPYYLAGRQPVREDNVYARFFAAADKKRFYEKDGGVRTADDDRPFPWRGVIAVGPAASLPVAAAIIVVAAVFLALPLSALKKQSARGSGEAGFLLYYAALGAALAAVATSLVPKVAFYLGGGSWGAPVAWAFFLAAAAGGSALSVKLSRRRRWVPFLGAGIALALYLGAYDGVIASTLAWTPVVKIYLAAVMVALVAFFLGALVPLGFTVVAGREPLMLPWTWAVFTAAYAFGGVVAPAAAAAAGFRLTTLVALALVAGAWFALAWASHRELPPAPGEGTA